MKPGGSAIRDSLPTRAQIRPVLLALIETLGEEATAAVLDSAVADHFALTPEQRSFIHSGTRTELAYRCAWVRTAAKKDGMLIQTRARTWALAEQE